MSRHIILTTTRSTRPDPVALLAAIKAQTGDATAVLITHDGRTALGKKATPWTPEQVADAQTLLDTTAPLTPQLSAQQAVDRFPIEYRALVLALVDAINTLRTHPAIGLPAITPAQAINAIRAKAGTLSGG
jgi:hypothetical protein